MSRFFTFTFFTFLLLNSGSQGEIGEGLCSEGNVQSQEISATTTVRQSRRSTLGLADGQSMFTDSFLVPIVVVSILVYCRTMWSPTRQPADRPSGSQQGFSLARPPTRSRIQRLPIPSILQPRRRCLIELFSSPGLVAKLIKFSLLSRAAHITVLMRPEHCNMLSTCFYTPGCHNVKLTHSFNITRCPQSALKR